MSVGDIYKLQVWSTIPDQVADNTIYFDILSDTGAGPPTIKVVQAFDAAIAALFRDCISSAAKYEGSSGQLWAAGTKPRPDFVGVNAGFGTGGANLLPTQVSGLITWKTTLVGRANRGRMYVPFPSPTQLAASGHPVAGYKTRLDAFAAAVITGLTVVYGADTATLLPVIVRRGLYLGIYMTTGYGNPKWATQRKRGDYERHNAFTPP